MACKLEDILKMTANTNLTDYQTSLQNSAATNQKRKIKYYTGLIEMKETYKLYKIQIIFLETKANSVLMMHFL